MNKIEKKKEIEKIYLKYADEIVNKENMQRMKNYIQHGNTSCYIHSLIVAYISLELVRKFNIKCDEKSLVRGALLHDYFLYDWHDSSVKLEGLHGFVHPKIALKNAEKEFELNLVEKDIIRRHMFPLTITPPKYREAYIVSIADKISSTLEVFRLIKRYNEIVNSMLEKLEVC